MSDMHDDHWFRLKVRSWTRIRAPLHHWFDQDEIDAIEAARGRFEAPRRRIVSLSFENRFAACGGLAAVMRRLPRALHAGGEQSAVVTPLYENIPAVRAALEAGELVETARCAAGGCRIYTERASPVETYHLAVDGRFQARENPYAYDHEELLARDALAFCAAVPQALDVLGMTDHVCIHAHDWETALASLFIKDATAAGRLGAVLTVCTLHNAFDAALPGRLLAEYRGRGYSAGTFLATALPLMDGPLTTVSTAFARELRRDPLQTDIFTPHLQDEFDKNPPLGVENGIFGTGRNPLGAAVCARAAGGAFSGIAARKREWRAALEETVKVQGAKRGSVLRPGRTKPLFFMSGRLDVAQKGFDVIFHAFDQLERGRARLLFTPSIPRAMDRDTLSFFASMIDRWEGDGVMWPDRLPEKLYRQCMKGASFLLMPSLYEPFGAATEAYGAATPVIARATGGLWQQVVPRRPCPAPPFYGTRHDMRQCGPPTGILYREAESSDDIGEQWRALLRTPPAGRMALPLYRSMVSAATSALEEAIELFASKTRYAKTIYNGILLLERFGWQRAVARYRAIYDTASAGR
jgi:glycogen synthase